MSDTARTPWPHRFGTMTKLTVKQGKSGRYGIIEIDCRKFTQTAFIFREDALEKAMAAGEGAQVWAKGPVEAVQRRNADGATYSEDVFKVVYFKDNTRREDAPADEAEASPEAA